MSASLRPDLGRLRRRLRIGLFLEIWPAWAIASLLVAGTFAVICRMFVVLAAPYLPWLWLAPIVAAVPVLVICWRRAYRPAEIVALADSLGGGQGILLTLFETNGDADWRQSALVERASTFALPRFALRRTMVTLISAATFLAVGLLLPQRVARTEATAALAEQIAANLSSTVVELKQQELISPEEEKRLEEEIERVRRGAENRVDAAAWEASDAMRERMVASLSEKEAAVKWAQESLARFAAVASADGAGTADAEAAQTAELSKALEKLAASGLLAGAPADLRGLLKDGRLTADPATLRKLAATLAKYLGDTNQRFGQIAGLGREFGRFDPSEFPIGSNGPDGDGEPGRGGVTRGRADAALTFGKETALFDRFKSQPLPPGAARTPDDWAPVVTLPGAPQEAPVLSGTSVAREYSSGSGQSAWRRSLAPRHQTAVKKYFDADAAKKPGGGERNRN